MSVVLNTSNREAEHQPAAPWAVLETPAVCSGLHFKQQLFDALNASALGGAAGQGQEQGLPNREAPVPEIASDCSQNSDKPKTAPATAGSDTLLLLESVRAKPDLQVQKNPSKGRALNLVLSYPANEGLWGVFKTDQRAV